MASRSGSGSGSGGDDFAIIPPPPPRSDSDARFTALMEQLARSNEQIARSNEQIAKSHEAQMGMQSQIAAMLEMQSQMQAHIQSPPVIPVPPLPHVETQVVLQHKDKDPHAIFERFRKRGAMEFHGDEDVMKADEWLEHIEDVFETVVCTQKQRLLLISTMFKDTANTWWKSVRDSFKAMPAEGIWEIFRQQFQRKFVPEHVQQKEEAEFLTLKQGHMTVAVYVHTFLKLSKYALELIDTEAKKLKRFLVGINPEYKAVVLAGQKPTTFDEAVDRAYTAEEIQREKEAEKEAERAAEALAVNAKRSGDSWFKKGGPSRSKRQKHRFIPRPDRNERRENRPVCATCGRFHRTESCWRTTGACLICGSLEHRMAFCPRGRRDDRPPYPYQALGQAALPAPPPRLALPAPPPRPPHPQPPRQGQQRPWQRQQPRQQQQAERPQIAGMACAASREQADVAANVVEGPHLLFTKQCSL